MTVKYFLTLAAVCMFSFGAMAQNWQLLHSDPQGDVGVPSGVQDAQSLAYAVDSTMDSLWFRVVLYDTIALDRDWGFFMGLDTDQDTANGAQWNGYQNNSLRYDYTIEFYNNAFFPPTVNNLITHDQQLVTDSIYYRIEAEHTLIIRLPLSLIDNDTRMNVIAAWGDFTGSRWDDLPNSGFVATAPPATGTPANPALEQLRVGPVPAHNQLVVFNGSLMVQQLRLLDSQGRSVKTAQGTTGSNQYMVVSDLAPGLYLLHMETTAGTSVQKVLVK